MTEPLDPLELARRYHDALPLRIHEYLNHRGIVDAVIDLHLLGWNGERITIPIFDRDDRVAFFKLAKDPEDHRPGPKMLTPAGASVELYGWERVRVKPCRIVICEGEFDRLVLEGHGFAAVTSTGGAGVFRREWAEDFKPIPEVSVCFDRDEAGRSGAVRVVRMIPHARIVDLPEEVGEGGDVTDFFVRLGRSREDFLRLLEAARPLPNQGKTSTQSPRNNRSRRPPEHEVERLKSTVRLEELVGRYVPLRRSGQTFVGRCPFHEDRNPSFTVYLETRSFHCYGCGAHGDAIEFLMRVERLTFPETLKVLRELTP